MFRISFFPRFEAKKNAQKHQLVVCNWTPLSSNLSPHRFVRRDNFLAYSIRACQAFFRKVSRISTMHTILSLNNRRN